MVDTLILCRARRDAEAHRPGAPRARTIHGRDDRAPEEAGLGDIATRLANLLQSINQGSDAAVPERQSVWIICMPKRS